MCKTCYCEKCNSQCYVCGNCERPITMDTYVELEGVEEKFCNETCANSYERAQQELSMLYSAEEKEGEKKMRKKYSAAEAKQIGRIAWGILEVWTNINKEHPEGESFDAFNYFEKTQQASNESFKLAEKFYELLKEEKDA